MATCEGGGGGEEGGGFGVCENGKRERHGSTPSATMALSAPRLRPPAAVSTRRPLAAARQRRPRAPAARGAADAASAPLAGAAPADAAPPPTPAPTFIDVTIEPAPSNARRLYAAVDVDAPPFAVWAALTDYERLADFVPGLAENRCLSRGPARATLLQVAEKPLALGLRFRARVVLDIQEHEEGLPDSMTADLPPSSGDKLAGAAAGLFPAPRAGPPPATGRARDISFALIEGDFAAFRGVWRVQDGGQGVGGGPRTRLAYALFVRPQPWLPVHLVAARVSGDIASNLAAVRDYTEKAWRGGG